MHSAVRAAGAAGTVSCGTPGLGTRPHYPLNPTVFSYAQPDRGIYVTARLPLHTIMVCSRLYLVVLLILRTLPSFLPPLPKNNRVRIEKKATTNLESYISKRVSWVSIICASNAQNARLLQAPQNNGHGWDIRLAVPGQPGNDYPTLATIPRTSFSCAGREPGYYADIDTNCQVFRVCTVGATYGFQSFLCPNGTLFNQAVFVCDWWMNVNCKNSDEVLRNKNEQFENLKLGTQLMKDIKNILTHPVRNPFNTNTMKSKLLVMQSYKPPSGQLFPNGALLAPPERAPSHIYIPTKAIQIALRQNEYRPPTESFAASTSNPQYIPPTFSTLSPTTVRNVEILQRQVLNTQNIQNTNSQSNSSEQIISNGHAGQVQTQNRYSQSMINFKNDQTNRQLQKYNNFRNSQRAQSNTEFNSVQTRNSHNTIQAARTFGNNAYQLRNKDKKNNSNNVKPLNPVKQQYTYETSRQPSAQINQTQTSEKMKQSLVSSDIVPPTILTKTLTYSRLIQEPKEGQPKARITFKTWVLKPTKNAKLIANPTPYTYNEPTSVKEESEFEGPYSYNKPSESVSLENTPEPETSGYNYDKPTEPPYEASSTDEEVSPLYVSATTLRPSIKEPLITTTIQPTQASRLYLAPENRNPSARQYLPPAESVSILANQYFSPKSSLRQLSRYQNSESFASRTKPTADTPGIIRDTNPLHTNRLSNSDINHKNFSFYDYLSKEKLDITVNEIVNDTNEILGSESPENFGQYYQKLDSIVSNNLPSESNSEDKEELTERPGTLPKPIKLVAVPSNKLEPPTETFDNYENSNKYSKLPFIKESVLPTIERTVSIKITIPESIANFIFKTPKDAQLEILNTGNSNYLVLRNTENDNSNTKFTPIGKLTWNENFNHSASQALVFSLLTDSINKAKKYNNVIQDNVQSLTSPPPQFQGVNNEEFGRITNTISQLTASQFTNNNYKTLDYNKANSASVLNTQSPYISNKDENLNFSKYKQNPAGIKQNDKLQSKPNNKQLNPFISVSGSNTNTNTPIYSGQLYKYSVPEVTRQIINAPNPANSNILIQPDIDEVKSQRVIVPKNSITKSIDTSTNINANIFKSRGAINTPVRLEELPTEKPQLKTQNNVLNTETGITAQLRDKIVGTIPHPTDKNKFVTYKKDESYYLYSNLDDVNSASNEQAPKQSVKQYPNNYPDLITFHFIPSGNQNEKESFQNEPQSYQLTELKPVENNNRIELTDNNINDDTYSTDLGYNVIRPSQKQSQTINTLYDGPSSYSAPQLSIGNLISTQEGQRNNINSRIEGIEENNNFSGYSKERPARQFTFK
ncbi:hypothetical protein RR46_07767 [Papilio xuthus]|uniref:Chitin-binding type-2 domain-containing protein n=1 Tax=Papilio xuthus TaxID=66420 RepID=A0A194QEP3_PAPXU|nr:hypothetical protein RR46_07767 [Papilio xuthus]